MSRTRLEELVWRKNLMRGNLSDVNADHLRYALRCYDQAWGLEPEPVLVNLAVHSDLYSFMERARLVELVAPLGLYQGCSHRGIFRVSRERMRFDLRRLLPPPVVAVNLPQLGDVLVVSTHFINNLQPFTFLLTLLRLLLFYFTAINFSTSIPSQATSSWCQAPT